MSNGCKSEVTSLLAYLETFTTEVSTKWNQFKDWSSFTKDLILVFIVLTYVIPRIFYCISFFIFYNFLSLWQVIIVKISVYNVNAAECISIRHLRKGKIVCDWFYDQELVEKWNIIRD